MLGHGRMGFVMAGVLTAFFLVGSAGCEKMRGKSEEKDRMAAGPKSLYHRLGGEPAIRAVVDDFVAAAAADAKVNLDRKNPPKPTTWDATPEKVAEFKERLVAFITQATGGPKTYEGQPMDEAHRGMQITEEEFDALAGHLRNTLVKLKVPQKEQDELMAVVGSTKSDIVGK